MKKQSVCHICGATIPIGCHICHACTIQADAQEVGAYEPGQPILLSATFLQQLLTLYKRYFSHSEVQAAYQAYCQQLCDESSQSDPDADSQ